MKLLEIIIKNNTKEMHSLHTSTITSFTYFIENTSPKYKCELSFITFLQFHERYVKDYTLISLNNV